MAGKPVRRDKFCKNRLSWCIRQSYWDNHFLDAVFASAIVFQLACEQELFQLPISLGNPCGAPISVVFRQLKLYWPLHLSLNDYRPHQHLVAVSNIPDL